MVTLNVVPCYRGTSKRLDVTIHLEGTLSTQYELDRFLAHLKQIGELLPTDTDPDA